MSTDVSTPARPLTRPSGLGAVGWLLPLVLLLPAAALAWLAVHELDRLYQSDTGILRAEQLVPYPLALRYGDVGHDDPVSSARLDALHERWQRLAERSAEQAATTAWRERSGRGVVIVGTLSDDPTRVVAALRAGASRGQQVLAWREGDRAVAALVVSPGPSDQAIGSMVAARADVARTSIRVQRAASLTVGAVLPVVALVLLFVAVLVAAAVVILPPLLLYLWAAKLVTGRRPDLGARRRRTGAVAPVRLDSGVEVMTLPAWRRPGRSRFLRSVPLAVVALPAATSALWPASLAWAGVIGLVMTLSMQWAKGSSAARWLRRVLYLTLLLGLTHALFAWPASPIGDRRVLAVLVGTAVLVAVLAIDRRRSSGPAGGLLALRVVVFLVGFLVIAAASVALFLGSNGATDGRTQLQVKAMAVPGLLLLPLGARRLRAARAMVLRNRLRRRGAPEVLYLRSFSDDRLRVRSERRARDGLERWLPWPSERFEDVLLRGMERIGPVVSIGRPGSEQSELGAARDLVIGPDWVTAVKQEMDTARLITVVLGSGQGLHVELVALAEQQCLDRVCVVVPPVAAAEAAERLAGGTRALASGGWGTITGDAVAEHGDVVALVGIGERRLVMVARRRARASTYAALAAGVARLMADAVEVEVR
jgi:hypothetical protein